MRFPLSIVGLGDVGLGDVGLGNVELIHCDYCNVIIANIALKYFSMILGAQHHPTHVCHGECSNNCRMKL